MLIARHTEYLYNLLQDPYTKEAIDKALSEYPMYVPTNKNTYSIIPTREQLNKKLLDHYQFREIGQEVPGMFIEELRVAMNEIMPYYYSLYKSADIMNGIEDPFGNVDITESFEQNTEGTSKGISSGKAEGKTISNTKTTNDSETTSNAKSTNNSEMQNNSKNVQSDRPQTLLNLKSEEIDSVNYANKVTWNEDKSNSKGETTDEGKTTNKGTTNDEGTTTSESSSSGKAENETTGKTTHTLRKVGNQGVNTYAHDMKELREVFINIEKQIIDDKRIRELFYLVFE